MSGTLVTTVGIAVMPEAAAAASAQNAVSPGLDGGVRAVTFPGTVSGLFGNPQRALFGLLDQGPYVFLYAVGFADGRVTHLGASDPVLADLGEGVSNALANIFTTAGNPCREMDIRC